MQHADKKSLQEFFQVKSFRELQCTSADSKIWIDTDDIFQFFKTNHTQFDKPVKKSNLLRELSNSVKEVINEKVCITINTLFRYIFNHETDYSVCGEIISDVLRLITTKPTSSTTEETFELATNADSLSAETTRTCSTFIKEISATEAVDKPDSVFQLYQDITTIDLAVPSDTFDIQVISESILHYIFLPYKSLFTESDWNKICKFENHFQITLHEKAGDDLSTSSKLLKQKRSFLNACIASKNLGVYWQNLNRRTCVVAKERRDAANVLNGIVIDTGIIHLPSFLDKLLTDVVKEISGDECNVVCVECAEACSKTTVKGIHVFCELKKEPETIQTCADISVICRASLKDHLPIHELIFLQGYSILSKHDGLEPERYTLRDKYYSKCLKDNVIFVDSQICDEEIEVDTFDGEHCCLCFKKFEKQLHNPLSISTFTQLSEWQKNIPLPLKLLLEYGVINDKSVRKAREKSQNDEEKLIVNKLGRLQCVVDILLNTFNKNHFGITQEVNTSVLAVNHHSASRVFSITQASGISLGIDAAEDWLKQLADPERCYFETFVKKHPLLYKKVGSDTPTLQYVSVRECHLIFCIDNLVRLRTLRDPEPGASKTSQLCTLPITVKGLPKNADVTTTWHLPDCTWEPTCHCKDGINLTKNDMEECIFSLTTDEREMMELVSRHTIWGTIGVIIKSPILHNLIEEAMGHNDQQDVSNLQQSFQDMSIDEETAELTHSFTSMSLNATTELQDLEAYFNEESEEMSHLLDSVTAGDANIQQLNFPQKSKVSLFCSDDIDDTIDEVEAEELLEDCAAILQNLPSLPERNSPEQDLNVSSLSDIPAASQTSSSQVQSELWQNQKQIDESATSLGSKSSFTKYSPPPLLCKHPPPAVGKDDDKFKLQEILDDFLVKSGQTSQVDSNKDRILFAPDQKISGNMFTLMQEDKKYRKFLPEFPVLHLLKSKITNLFSAYKSCGLFHLLKFMQDDEDESDWAKLVTISHVETAVRNIRRLALTLHLAFLIRFVELMDPTTSKRFMNDLVEAEFDTLSSTWQDIYKEFMSEAKCSNATFLLHTELSTHCDEIVALALAERLGGHCGYQLLLAIVKSSLPFAYVNGAAAYAKFSTLLLHEHQSAGFFHQHLKSTLFSTPHGESDINFSLDCQREMDHRDALKAFRPSSGMRAVLPRMSIIDFLSSAEKKTDKTSEESKISKKKTANTTEDYMGRRLTETDMNHVIPTVRMILRQKILSVEKDPFPRNKYDAQEPLLSECNLDSKTFSIGNYLIQRFLCQEGLFCLTEDDVPCLADVDGPKILKQRVKAGKSITITRGKSKSEIKEITEKQKKEESRQKLVQKVEKMAQHTSSAMNTCQALVQPNCKKKNVLKSSGMRTALLSLVSRHHGAAEEVKDASEECILLDQKKIPLTLASSTKTVVVEFAGVKFKIFGKSGTHYLHYVETGILQFLIKELPCISHIIICEEKYSFTPNDFKSMTREKREKRQQSDIHHLKGQTEMISADKFSKAAVTKTLKGKCLISNFLAENVGELHIKKDLTLDIDSENLISRCQCQDSKSHQEEPCKQYAIPQRSYFSKDKGYEKSESLHEIHQRKGEAELSQADWLCHVSKEMPTGQTIVSYVTSGDIDSVPIHILAVALHLPRTEHGKLKHKVYVILKKPGGKAAKLDIYNITAIVEKVEMMHKENNIALILSFTLCLGGNDFLPKFHGISHDKLLKVIFGNDHFRKNLFMFRKMPETGEMSCQVNKEEFLQVMKHLYCPNSLDPEKLKLEEVRQLTISNKNGELKNPQLWMPPQSALRQLVKLYNSFIKYYGTIGTCDADLPNFIEGGGIKRVGKDIEYDFGPDVHYDTESRLLTISDGQLQEARRAATRPKKRSLAEGTRPGKRKPMTSTPRKIRDMRTEKESSLQNT